MSHLQICLNTSTIRSKGSTILDSIDTAASAGYDGIEPWVEEIDRFVADGGTLAQVREHAINRNIQIVNLIAFPEWAVPEDNRRTKGFQEAERCLSIAQSLECPFIAAPPSGIHDRKIDLEPIADHFAKLFDLALQYNVIPLLEFWGIAKTLGTAGEALFVAAECGRPGVQLLADIFHMYKGSGHHFGFEHFGPDRLGLIHVNDYPSTPSRNTITDAERIYPGDGRAPWGQIVANLRKLRYRGMLSLELFNQAYWNQGPQETAREGIEKLKRCLNSSESAWTASSP